MHCMKKYQLIRTGRDIHFYNVKLTSLDEFDLCDGLLSLLLILLVADMVMFVGALVWTLEDLSLPFCSV